jgi:hypothetical protein
MLILKTYNRISKTALMCEYMEETINKLIEENGIDVMIPVIVVALAFVKALKE